MRVAIFGASGLLGKALMGEWSGDAVVGYSSRDVDIRDASAVRAIAEETEPEWIVLAAAYTDVDGCENNPDLAFTVNRDGAVNVAEAAKETGPSCCFLARITFSMERKRRLMKPMMRDILRAFTGDQRLKQRSNCSS